MNFTFDGSVGSRMRQWAQNALAQITYPLDNIGDDVLIEVVSEPSCTGHKDMMCTHDDGSGGWVIEIREGIDDASSPALSWLPAGTNVQAFFEECIVHEVGHVVSFSLITSDGEKTATAARFVHDSAGDRRTGLLADWNPTDSPWPDRVQEAVAEVWKDNFFEGRVFDNRTNWLLPPGEQIDFMADIGASGGTDIVTTTFDAFTTDAMDSGVMWASPAQWLDYAACDPSFADDGNMLLVASPRRELHKFDPADVGQFSYNFYQEAPTNHHRWRENEATDDCYQRYSTPHGKVICWDTPEYMDIVMHIEYPFSKFLESGKWWQLRVIFQCEIDKPINFCRSFLESYYSPSGANFMGDGKNRNVMNEWQPYPFYSDWDSLSLQTMWGHLGVAHDSEFSDWTGAQITRDGVNYREEDWKAGEPDDGYDWIQASSYDPTRLKHPQYVGAAETEGHSIIGVEQYIGHQGVDYYEMEIDYALDEVHVWYRFIKAPVYMYVIPDDVVESYTFELSNPFAVAYLQEEVDLPMAAPYPYTDSLAVSQGPTGVQRMG